LIRSSTTEGQTVLDPFCGSGAVIEAAVSSGRKAIGVDLSEYAIGTTTRRMAALENVAMSSLFGWEGVAWK
jgi:DNA modification methylase